MRAHEGEGRRNVNRRRTSITDAQLRGHISHIGPPLVSSEGEEDEHASAPCGGVRKARSAGPREASVLVRLSAESLSEQQFILHRDAPTLSVIPPKTQLCLPLAFISVAAA